MLSGTDGGTSMSSGGMTGTSSHDHRPKSENQILVKTRVRSRPPASRMYSRARVMCSALGGSPASLSAAYDSTVVERSAGAPQKLPQVPSSRCFERIHFADISVCSSVRMPRNCRRRRSSASMVTFVSSSPFHQPSGDWSERRWSTARSSVAWTPVAVTTVNEPSLRRSCPPPAKRPPRKDAGSGRSRRLRARLRTPRGGALQRRGGCEMREEVSSLELALHDEAGESVQLFARGGIDRGALELAQRETETPFGLLGRVAPPAARLDELGSLGDLVFGKLRPGEELAQPLRLGAWHVERGHHRKR